MTAFATIRCPSCTWELLRADDGTILYCDHPTCRSYREPYTVEEIERRAARKAGPPKPPECVVCDRVTDDVVSCEVCAEERPDEENAYCAECRAVCKDCSRVVCFDHATKGQCRRCQYAEGLSSAHADAYPESDR